jgi:hypothetical protein
MPFTPPNTFVSGTTLTAADLEGNYDALRVYLHGAIPAADVQNVNWIDTRHIQPPLVEPFSGLQHGVSGYQGGQWSGGSITRLSFVTKYLTGQGAQGTVAWHRVPNTSFTLSLRSPAFILYHYAFEVEAGPDNGSTADQVAQADRQIWVAPYELAGTVQPGFVASSDTQQSPNHTDTAFASGSDPRGPQIPYTIGRSYGQRTGTKIIDGTGDNTTFPRPVGQVEIGLCAYSTIDRAAIINWSVAIETYYL